LHATTDLNTKNHKQNLTISFALNQNFQKKIVKADQIRSEKFRSLVSGEYDVGLN
jgi:hypothetical protein